MKNPLFSNEISGNTLNLNEHTKHYPYHCPKCDEDIPEDEWNDKRGQCFSCWWNIK